METGECSDLYPHLDSWAKMLREYFFICYTVKPVLSGHSKIDKTKVLKPCGSSMQVESIAECSPWSILQYF